MFELIYITIIFFVLLLILYVFISLLTDFLGAPFVPTSGKIIDEILKSANLRPGQVFIELGSGDGRVVRRAVKNFKVYGIGIELNFFLVLYAKILSRIQSLRRIEFRVENFFNTDLSSSDIIFLFLLPKALERLKIKIEKEAKKETLVISHGFKIKGWDKYLIKSIKRDLFPTFYYKPGIKDRSTKVV